MFAEVESRRGTACMTHLSIIKIGLLACERHEYVRSTWENATRQRIYKRQGRGPSGGGRPHTHTSPQASRNVHHCRPSRGHTCRDPLGFTVGKAMYEERDCMLACLGSRSVEHMHFVMYTLCRLSVADVQLAHSSIRHVEEPWF